MEDLGYNPTLNECEVLSVNKNNILKLKSYAYKYVYTPNGTPVEVMCFDDDLSSAEINFLNDTYDDLFPQADRLSASTRFYNCHSYAWYLSNNMNIPWSYYNDGSYYEVTDVDIGDIICYYDSDGNNLHSGTVIDKGQNNNLSSLIVESKWGSCGLYVHNGDYCPYMPEFGGDTSYVKYYRHTKHTYNQEYANHTNQFHKRYCLCGDYTLSRHTIKASQTSGRYAQCMACGALLNLDAGIYPTLPSSLINYKTVNGSYIMENGIVAIANADVDLYLRGGLVIAGELIL